MFKVFRIISKGKQNSIFGLLMLYKLMCQTYLLYKTHENDRKTFRVKSREIVHCLEFQNNLTPTQYNQMIDKQILMDKFKIQELEKIIIKVHENVWEKKLMEDVKIGLENIYCINISKKVNEKITSKLSKKISVTEQEMLEEILKY